MSRSFLQRRGAQPYGLIKIPGGDRIVINVYRDADGRFYTAHPRLRGPFRDLGRLSIAIRHKLSPPACRSVPLELTLRAPSPVVTEDPKPPLQSEHSVAGVADPASALTLQQADASSPEMSLHAMSSEGLITEIHNATDASPLSTSLLESPILSRTPHNWYHTFYIRKDQGGRFHMYPDVGGPFHTLEEAEAAISRHLNERQLPAICQKPSEGPLVEWCIKQSLFYPDGTPKRGPNSPAFKNPDYSERQLVKALLDQYNDHQNLCEDLAHELKDLVTFHWIYENHKDYYHFNFTTKTKKADDGSLFFAEVLQKEKEDFLVITCCCMIKPNDDGVCFGCINNGIKTIHPHNSRAYIGGHVKGYLPFGMDDSSDEEDDEAFVARLRLIYADA